MNRAQILASAYLAGRVERYHTWPTICHQTVGEHTWQILRLYCQIFGPPAPAVTEAIVWHDAGELVTGDPPFPVKARNPVLKAEFDRIEAEAVVAMGGVTPHLYDGEDRVRIKCCELLEMHEYGRHEVLMGNRYAEPIVEDTLAALEELVLKLHDDDRARVRRYVALGGEVSCV